MDMSSRQLDVRIQSPRERYRLGSHQYVAGIFAGKTVAWKRSPVECVARADLLDFSVFRGQAEEKHGTLRKSSEGQRRKTRPV